MPNRQSPLTIRLCGPRGFCAGVDRAIQIVVLALKKYGAPVYVRHEIVHNRYVVEGLQNLGAVFIEELSEIPPEHRDSPVVFSAMTDVAATSPAVSTPAAASAEAPRRLRRLSLPAAPTFGKRRPCTGPFTTRILG